MFSICDSSVLCIIGLRIALVLLALLVRAVICLSHHKPPVSLNHGLIRLASHNICKLAITRTKPRLRGLLLKKPDLDRSCVPKYGLFLTLTVFLKSLKAYFLHDSSFSSYSLLTLTRYNLPTVHIIQQRML
jgi:hypothetical protein